MNGFWGQIKSTCNQSIPIPLGSLSWSWSGDAIDTETLQTSGTTQGTTFVLSSCSSGSEGSFVSGGSYAQWQNVVPFGITYGQMQCVKSQKP